MDAGLDTVAIRSHLRKLRDCDGGAGRLLEAPLRLLRAAVRGAAAGWKATAPGRVTRSTAAPVSTSSSPRRLDSMPDNRRPLLLLLLLGSCALAAGGEQSGC